MAPPCASSPALQLQQAPPEVTTIELEQRADVALIRPGVLDQAQQAQIAADVQLRRGDICKAQLKRVVNESPKEAATHQRGCFEVDLFKVAIKRGAECGICKASSVNWENPPKKRTR